MKTVKTNRQGYNFYKLFWSCHGKKKQFVQFYISLWECLQLYAAFSTLFRFTTSWTMLNVFISTVHKSYLENIAFWCWKTEIIFFTKQYYGDEKNLFSKNYILHLTQFLHQFFLYGWYFLEERELWMVDYCIQVDFLFKLKLILYSSL